MIPLKATSNRGLFPSLKPHLKGVVLEYESQLERDSLLLLDHDPNCIDLQTQPVLIAHMTESGRETCSYPDCWALFSDGQEYLFEVKPEHQYQNLIHEKAWEMKVKSIQEYCFKLHWTYQVITERKIHCTRLNNIKDLLAAAKHFGGTRIGKSYNNFESCLKNTLQDPLDMRNLVHSLSAVVPLAFEEIISYLKIKIYFNELFLNWDVPLENAAISLRGKLPCPVCDLPEKPSNGVSDNLSPNMCTRNISPACWQARS